MERREYFYELTRLRKLTVTCGLLKVNYDPSSTSAFDDYVVFSQLDMDLISLQAKIKFWEQDQKLFDLIDESPEHEDSPVISPTSEAPVDQLSVSVAQVSIPIIEP